MARSGVCAVFVMALLGVVAGCGSSDARLFEKGSATLTPTGGGGGAAGSGGSTGGGSTASGGNAGVSQGTGGASTGGTAATGVCASHTSGTGVTPGIDDFEDRDGDITAAEGRSGTWGIWNDMTSWQQPTTALPALIPVARGASRYAMHTSGGRFTDWGAAVGFELSQCHDAVVYNGVRFWLFSNVPVVFAVHTPPTVPTAEGGECAANCYGHFSRRISPTPNVWGQHVVPWTELTQPSGAPVASFDPATILGMEFDVSADDLVSLPLNGVFDVWIDDIEFY